MALWDTGATQSLISRRVIQQCDLLPRDVASVNQLHTDRPERNDLYPVSIELPDGILFPRIQAIHGEVEDSRIHVVIGMDIIGRGDFAVTNLNGRTVFTYRYPSVKVIDFEQE